MFNKLIDFILSNGFLIIAAFSALISSALSLLFTINDRKKSKKVINSTSIKAFVKQEDNQSKIIINDKEYKKFIQIILNDANPEVGIYETKEELYSYIKKNKSLTNVFSEKEKKVIKDADFDDNIKIKFMEDKQKNIRFYLITFENIDVEYKKNIYVTILCRRKLSNSEFKQFKQINNSFYETIKK